MKLGSLLVAVLFLLPSTSNAQSDAPAPRQLSLGYSFPVSDVKDQGASSFCWAYSLTSFLETRVLQKGKSAVLSPRYLGVYHLLFKIKTILPELYIAALRSDVLAQNSQLESLKQIHADRITARRHSDRAMSPAMGNLAMPLALMKAVGMVPDEVVSDENLFYRENSEKSYARNEDLTLNSEVRYLDFIQTHLTNLASLERFLNSDRELLIELAKVFQVKPLLPDSEFQYQGKTYTPLTFLNDYLEVSEKTLVSFEWRNFRYDSDANFDFMMNLVLKALEKNREVPLSIALIGESYEKIIEFQDAGVLLPCAENCKIYGGHVVTVVNTIKNTDGQIVALVTKNSYGTKLGATLQATQYQNGNNDGGFLIIPVSYLYRMPLSHIVIERPN